MRDLKALYTNLRIKYKLFLLLTIVLIVMSVVGTVMQQYAFQVYDEKIYQQSSKALSLSSISIENELDKMEKLSFAIATDTTIQKYLRLIKNGGTNYDNYIVLTNIRDRMVDLGGLDKYVKSIQIYDVNNREYAVGAQAITMNLDRLSRVKKESLVNQGGNTWVSPDTDDHSFTAAREIRSFQNMDLDYLGTLAIRIDTNKLFADYTNAMNNNEAEMIILNNNEAIYPETSSFPIEALHNFADGDKGYRLIKEQGKSYFVTYFYSSELDWTYYTVISFDDIFHSIVQVKNTMIIALVILLIVSLVFALRFANQITKPIERLNTKMKRVQLGNFENVDQSAEPELAMDEVGQMHRNFRVMLERINDLIQENYVKQLAIKDTQFKALQAQINPHFLYNTLESINWSAKMSNQTQISQMVEALGSLLRTSINLKEPIIPISKELEIVSHYITIQGFRFEERLDFQMDVPEELLYCGIPKLSLQPLIENAVNYGLEQMIDTCYIKIRVERQEELLFITVEDNGPGMKQEYADQLLQGEVQTKSSGLGLRNIEERIKLLYGESYGMTVKSGINEGTIVSLKLPFEMRDQLG
ncbi:MAG: sensor histidine kinase [Candidatus Pristimantibacillus sp.]